MISSLDNYLLNIFYWLLLVSKKIKFVNRKFRLPYMETEKKKKKNSPANCQSRNIHLLNVDLS